MISKINRFLEKAKCTVRRLSNDNRGVAAVEFAFIAPILITLYLGTLEVSGALQMNKKVGRAASTVGDLVSRLDKSNKDEIDAILKIGKAVTQPYSLTTPTVIVTGIYIDNTGTAKVDWSRKIVGSTITTPYAKGSTVTSLPSRIKINDTGIVRAEVTLQYRTLSSWTIQKQGADTFGKVDMAETYYMRPRGALPRVECSDCP